MNKKEQRRLMVISKFDKGELTGREAAELAGLSLRHLRRILAAYRKEGACALAHGNRGRKPRHALDESLKRQVAALAQSTYTGCNHQHFTELLAEREGITLSRSSVRRILLIAGIRSPRKRRPPKHRSRRERYPREGMLLQIDASRDDWLEGRGPYLSLVGAIDDATGKVPYALFRDEEDAQGYTLLLRHIVENRGRIERLWGTFQDRLKSELRIAGAKTIEEANRVLWHFLARFNERFAVAAREPGLAYRPVPDGFKPDEIFCFKYQRSVGKDNVVRFGGHRLQIMPTNGRLSYARAVVEVHERMDGSLAVYYKGQCLLTRSAPPEAPVLRTRSTARFTPRVSDFRELAHCVAAKTTKPKIARPYKPAPDHPWRRPFRVHIDRG